MVFKKRSEFQKCFTKVEIIESIWRIVAKFEVVWFAIIPNPIIVERRDGKKTVGFMRQNP